MNRSILLAALIAFTLGAPSAALAQTRAATARPTVVLVHGAWADGSSWDRVIPILQDRGFKVIAVQNPLTSLKDDVEAVRRVLDGQPGQVVLVGHSWGGAVITHAGNHDKVSALVYVAAFSPDEGQSVGEQSRPFPPTPVIQQLAVDATGFAWLAEDTVMKQFAHDLPASQSRVLAATQGPIASSCFDEKLPMTPAWRQKKSWFVITAKDRVVSPQMQRAGAKLMNATTTTINGGHLPMKNHARDVAAVIIDAAEKTRTARK